MESTQNDTDKSESDQSYLQALQAEMSGLIDELKLSTLRKQSLKSRWLDQVIWMEGRANRHRSWYYRLRLTAIVGGILIPLAVTISQVSALSWVAWIAMVLGVMVAISSSVEEFYHHGERWRNYRSSVEMLKSEGWQYIQLSGRFSRYKDHERAYERFTGRVEEIIQLDVHTYISEIVGEKQTDTDDDVAGKPSI